MSLETSSSTTTVEPQADNAEPVTETSAVAGSLIETDLLIEDVSIDGMCGVY